LTFEEGQLNGSGTVTGNVMNNAGHISPGGDGFAGTITIAGSYIQAGGGTLIVDLGGTVPGSTYDQLVVTDSATLGGVLNVSLSPGFVPALGNVFNVVTATARVNNFQSVVGEGALTINYTSTAAQLIRNGQSFTWDAGGGADTSWFNPLNWSPDGVPGPLDVAILNGAFTVAIDTSSATVGDFMQSAGVVTGGKNLTALSSYQWFGGAQSGTGVTFSSAEGNALIGGSAAKVLDGRTFVVQGNGIISGTGPITLGNGGQMQVFGVVELQGGAALQTSTGGGTVEVIGEGTLRKTGAAVATIPAGLTFKNHGIVEVLGGGLTILGSGDANDATFTAFPGTTITFNSAAGYGLSNDVFFNGGGILSLAGGTFAGANSTVIVAPGTTFRIAGGTFAASGDHLTVNGIFDWQGGSLTGNGVANFNGDSILSGPALKTLSKWKLNFAPGSNHEWGGTGTLSVQQNAEILAFGTIGVHTNFTIANGDGIGGTVSLVAGGGLTVNGGGNLVVGIPVTDAGSIVLAETSTAQFNAGLTQNAGLFRVIDGSTATIGGAAMLLQGGVVGGDGTINGSVNNTGGTVQPGANSSATGKLTITGNYTQDLEGRFPSRRKAPFP
jgi:hypothetical protein